MRSPAHRRSQGKGIVLLETPPDKHFRVDIYRAVLRAYSGGFVRLRFCILPIPFLSAHVL